MYIIVFFIKEKKPVYFLAYRDDVRGGYAIPPSSALASRPG